MPSTHSSLIFHVVFSTKEREVWLPPDFRPRLHAYLGGIIRNSGGTAYAVGGTGDHVHLFIGLKPTDVIPDLIQKDCTRIAETLNNRPRKRLGFRTPNEVYYDPSDFALQT